MLAPTPQQSYAELRKLNLLEGIPDDQLWGVVERGELRLVALERDRFLPEQVTASEMICLVASGQISIGVFQREELAARQAEIAHYHELSQEERSALVPEPLTRLARKNLAGFFAGDLFNTSAVLRSSSGGLAAAVFAAAPARLAVVSAACAADLVQRFEIFGSRMERAVKASHHRLANVVGVKQEILDFYIRQGLSVAGEMVRVRQLDRCIDCKLCELSCEDRYGSKRLTLGGYRLGMLDFVYTCRTCDDQRCVDPCAYDAIKFDAQLRQVRIDEARCTGCTLCAQLCPYGAIEMVDVEDPANPTYRERFKLRLDLAGKLKFGGGAARLAPARRVANKCDHCVDYSDQACVTACPTGALVELDGRSLFRERSLAAAAMARTGFDREVRRERGELLPTRPFVRGARIRDGGLARMRRWRVGATLTWILGMTAWLLCLGEVLLRTYVPEQSFAFYWLVNVELIEPGFALQKVSFRAGNTLAVYCGYVGTAMMTIAVLYPIVRRFKAFRLVANNQLWFDFHMMSGTVGPLFIVLHTAFKLDNWVSAAFWSMVIVVISGVIGRYMYTQVPDLLNGRELEELDHRRALRRLRERFPHAVEACEVELRELAASATTAVRELGLLQTFWWILVEDVRRPGRWWRRRRSVRTAGAPRAVAKEIVLRSGRLLLIERRRVLLPRAQMILHSWKKVHVPFSAVMVAISLMHIWVAFQYSM